MKESEKKEEEAEEEQHVLEMPEAMTEEDLVELSEFVFDQPSRTIQSKCISQQTIEQDPFENPHVMARCQRMEEALRTNRAQLYSNDTFYVWKPTLAYVCCSARV